MIRYNKLGPHGMGRKWDEEDKFFSEECKVFTCPPSASMVSWDRGRSLSFGSTFSSNFRPHEYLDIYKSYVFPSEHMHACYIISKALYEQEEHRRHIQQFGDKELDKYWFNNKNEYYDG